MILIFLPFVGLAVVIFFAGRVLTDYGDEISSRTGITRGWIGFILIAAVTSVPELASSLSALLITDLPDMAIGNLLGSNLFNLTLLAPVLLYSALPLDGYFNSRTHLVQSLLGFALGVIVLVAALLELPYLVLMGTGSLLIWVFYLAGIRTAMNLEGEAPPEPGERVRSDGGSFGLLILRFAAASGVIIAAGVLMVIWAEGTAAKTGWNTTFMGALFLALATSLPEASVVLSSFRIGAVDMALGNIFGSNAFNLAIIPLLDLVTPGVSIFRSFSERNLLLAFSFAAVNVLAVAFLRSPQPVGARRRGFAFLLLALYLASIYGVYRLG